jgi:hypothetical protein
MKNVGTILAVVLLCLPVFRARAEGPVVPSANVGMEGRVLAAVPGPPLVAKPVSAKAPLVVRIAASFPADGATIYDIRYIGATRGAFDLRDYLEHADGGSLGAAPAIPVAVTGLLPEKHSGGLEEIPAAPMPWLGGYRLLLAAVAIAWCVPLGMRLVRSLRRKPPEEAAPDAPPPTLAELIAALAERGATGALTVPDRARLERLLLAHWRRRVGAEGLTMMASLVLIRQEPAAARELDQLERWLHCAGGEASDVTALLTPYRNSRPAPGESAEAAEGGAS